MLDEEQLYCPVVHHFSYGIYMREVFLPAGGVIVGHEHKTPHMNLMLQGMLDLHNEDGSMTRIVAPWTGTTNPGRKIATILEDTVWINVHNTSEQDVEALEDLFMVKSEAFLNHPNTVNPDSATMVEACCPLPFGSYKFKKECNTILATATIHCGEIIGPAYITGGLTVLGRCVTIVDEPNAQLLHTGGTVNLVALRTIQDEIITISAEDSLLLTIPSTV